METGKVYTCRLNKSGAQDHESDNAKCQCGRKATYWSQKEGQHGKLMGGVVYHCQSCREWGRQKAETEPIKTTKKVLDLIAQMR